MMNDISKDRQWFGRSIRKLAIILACLLSSYSVLAQDRADSLIVYFRQGYSTYEPNFKGNQQRMDDFIKRIKEIQQDSTLKIIKVTYTGAASPEGEHANNARLARKRASVMSNYLHQHISFADNAVETVARNEDYIELENMVEASNMPYRNEVLEILRTIPTERMVNGVLHNPCKIALINLHGGQAWQYMLENFYPALRRFKLMVIVGVERPSYDEPVSTPVPAPVVEEVVSAPAQATTPVAESAVAPQPTPEPEPVVATPAAAPSWSPQMLVKSNVVGWGMAISNLAIEVELAKHFSFNLPVYYSGVDYFKQTTKFRTFGIYPEFRYWFKERDGWFIGAHGGLAYFNVAVGGDWRYQDTGGTTPALGGGLNVGYRMSLSKKHPRWKVEFTLGAGAYDVNYEKFVNEKDGPKAQGSVHKTAIALDNVGVSFSYSIDLKKRNK